MLDLESLEAKAKAAMSANPGVGEWDYDQREDKLNAGGCIAAYVLDESCGEFIAAANPKAILALIHELSEARAAVATEREACAMVCDARAERNEEEAAVADEDEQSNLRSAAWQMSVCAAEIRARGEKGGE